MEALVPSCSHCDSLMLLPIQRCRATPRRESEGGFSFGATAGPQNVEPLAHPPMNSTLHTRRRHRGEGGIGGWGKFRHP